MSNVNVISLFAIALAGWVNRRQSTSARHHPCNAYAERFVRSIKSECLERMILLGERSLRRALREYSMHYLSERNHQGVDNQLLELSNVVAYSTEPIQRRERLGGMLNFYHRKAA